MKMIICSPITAAAEVLAVREKLEAMGHEVDIPEGVKSERLRGRTEVDQQEKAKDKIEGDLIRGYFEKIKDCDAVLVVNPEKKGIQGYIGANTLIEMAFAHVLGKRLYILYALPEMPYSAEIIAMQPEVIDGDLTALSRSRV